jgi:hypothetical protein
VDVQSGYLISLFGCRLSHIAPQFIFTSEPFRFA